MYDYHQFMSTAVIMYRVKGEYSIVLPNTLSGLRQAATA